MFLILLNKKLNYFYFPWYFINVKLEKGKELWKESQKIWE